ncbi:uncharacterized protein EMH_0065930 [Eimeria mitis]|uniref:Uncharacterized protein n=1 Tax=Eimeria mitis TaxID=44415 RepID=U6K0V3_9EIME|nr:uncharacterized protein EMH_0065930 [Eimeria mitis]CDJ31340.1 hypothetical protein, conserved [Eimeria mitis]
MPRAPSPLTSEPLPYGHPSSTKDFLDSSTAAQSVSIPPVNSNGYDISKQMGGNGCYPGGANGNPCRAVHNGASGSQNPPGFSARQGVAKPLQNVPNVDKLDTCLARPSAPHNNEEQQPSTQMIASVGTCSVPVAIARAPPHGSTPRVAPLLILPPEDKLPSSAVATSPDFKRRYSAVHTEEVQTENAEASSGASKKHKLELTHKPAVGLQCSCDTEEVQTENAEASSGASKKHKLELTHKPSVGLQCSCPSKDETKKEILATAKQPGDRLPESGLPVMAALHTIPGTVVLRESRNRPVTLSQGEYVAAKMYFHPGKMAWRSELLVNGSKRQRSFSCKLYGFERAKKMCEWSRNFVLRTARLPTGDETKEAIGKLMGYTVQTNDTDEAIPHYAGWPKRQRSFSCKLYGFERAKKMCEWSRNFVLRTARLPTGDETKEAIGQLMGYTVQTNDTDEAIPHYAGWLYAYPPLVQARRMVGRKLLAALLRILYCWGVSGNRTHRTLRVSQVVGVSHPLQNPLEAKSLQSSFRRTVPTYSRSSAAHRH